MSELHTNSAVEGTRSLTDYKWQLGIAGNANIVTFDGDNIVGVGYAPQPDAIIAAHNKALSRLPAHQPHCDLADWDGRSNDAKPTCTCSRLPVDQEEINRLKAALSRILEEPFGCPACHSGTIITTGKAHWEVR